MKNKLLASLLICMGISTAGFGQDKKTIGSGFIKAFFSGDDAVAFNYFDDNMKSAVSIATLGQIRQQLVGKVGKYVDTISVTEKIKDALTVVSYYSKFENDNLDIVLVIGADNKLAGFHYAPHTSIQEKKPYADDADSLNIPSGNIILPGTLLLPASGGKKVLVIFVHGSGPEDRDETYGPNKIFKDMAETLQQQGIASYRFDKRTLVAPGSLPPAFTLDDEVTDDVANIVHWFKSDNRFSGYKIIIAGHSLGAMMIPRIANRLKDSISGAIMLSGNARPLQDLLLEQYNYLYTLDPQPEKLAAIEALKVQIDTLNGKGFSKQTPSNMLPFSAPYSYWNSIKTYKQQDEIKKTTLPLLIMQGGRDYQVTMEDFGLWKTALKNKKNGTFKDFPKLNHFYLEGEGKPNPTEYNNPGHVAAYVMDEIIAWINKYM